MEERSEIIACLRSEIVGPARPLSEPSLAQFLGREFQDSVALRRGPLAWKPDPTAGAQEVLYYERESPHRKYGAGLLHPAQVSPSPDEFALNAADTVGGDPGDSETAAGADDGQKDEPETDADNPDDFEVTSPDVRHPSTIGISFCVHLPQEGKIVVQFPQWRSFVNQAPSAAPFLLNGRYEACVRRWTDADGHAKEAPVWRRLPAILPDAKITIAQSELSSGRVVRKELEMPENSPLALRVDVFPRQIKASPNLWLLTLVLRNSTNPTRIEKPREAILYQTFFEAHVTGGHFGKYPESRRSFTGLDLDEQSLALLYGESATWAIGHGCAAGWDCEPGAAPNSLYADVMPAVEVPSMTPDIEVSGRPVQLSMRELANLPDQVGGPAWESLDNLANGYDAWIQRRREDERELPAHLAAVANRHLTACSACLDRIRTGITLLRNDARVRHAFRLANLAMLLQQISTKFLGRRELNWNSDLGVVTPQGDHQSPWSIYDARKEEAARIGTWRAFQLAFLLMSLDGVRDGSSADRELVDLIWFPTGGGKTEAYLGVMAFYMFHERLLMGEASSGLRRDGTNVLMRYTLRMLTTQQFQRAASLISAMEFLRRHPTRRNIGSIPGRRFSLGLWIGGDGTPNRVRAAKDDVAKFRSGGVSGNPLVLTECPWCRAEIGRYEGRKPQLRPVLSDRDWNERRTRGITTVSAEGPLLHCPDSSCEFGQEHHEFWLPVEVIDERIYQHPPSLVIATADKFAMISYRPAAGALFGKRFVQGEPVQDAVPPGLIVQDELHLISGPLGTMYALYESVFERLCSFPQGDGWIKPKLIASTATIRGAADQVVSLYGRLRTCLFPSPGLSMGDSFFGKYARDDKGALQPGRLYLGVHASDYGSVLTTQVRAFSSALFRPWSFSPNNRDPWWTLLSFYNSIRELGGAKTLFDSDIRSRLKFMFNREGFAHDDRRNIRIVEELTSRLAQADIVKMMDRLSATYQAAAGGEVLDACLASNIIEVGVDIDRLSLMGVVGQPKTTATYIQVTGRVGRRWWDRAGLILMIYNPSKSRDRSHFEQFHSYHRRLYERVEPTSATPFAMSAIQRGLAGALIAWARQQLEEPVQNETAYMRAVDAGYQLFTERCRTVQTPEDRERSLGELERLKADLAFKWELNPQAWEEFPPSVDGHYLMLWPGQFATALQQRRGVKVPSSMRQVDRSAELEITQGYSALAPAPDSQ